MPPLSQAISLPCQSISGLCVVLTIPHQAPSSRSQTHSAWSYVSGMHHRVIALNSLTQPGVVPLSHTSVFNSPPPLLAIFEYSYNRCRTSYKRLLRASLECECMSGVPQCPRCMENEEETPFKTVSLNGEGLIRRRTFGTGTVAGVAILPLVVELPAMALGDSTVTIEEVTPPIAPSGKLPSAEECTVELFERNTYSVVNIFDVTLRPQVNMTGSVEVPEGNGTGIIWDAQGHIVTNFHVIGSSLAQNPPPGKVVARVTLLGADGFQKNLEAKLVGADKTKDLAVLQVDAPIELLRPVNIGQSSKLKVGQRCLAIGNPFGFDHTLTVGVVSGLNRDIFSQTGVVIGGGIQTDAAINPGNSGGPLLDSKGKLIGINTAIFTRTGTSAGVGFAIPIDTVAKLVPQLIAYGKVMRPGLNVQFAPESVARQLNIWSGALVLSVPDTSAAAKAGLNPTRRGLAGNIILGDIIVAVGESMVKNAQELAKVLDGYQVATRWC